MTARFVEAKAFHGFDKRADPIWMMVPSGGTNTCYIEGANSVEIRCDRPEFASVQWGNKKPGSETTREIRVTGIKPNKGQPTKIIAHTKGSTSSVKAELDIDVFEKVEVTVGFNFVKDKAGKMTKRTKADVTKIVDAMNDIFRLQANIVFKAHTITSPFLVNFNLGEAVDMGTDESKNIFKANAKSSVQWNVFFVWGILKSTDTCHADGITCTGENTLAFNSKSNCMMEDTALQNHARAGLVLAHEAGHFLGYRHGRTDKMKDNLMYWAVKDKLITRNQARIFRNSNNWAQSPPPYGVE